MPPRLLCCLALLPLALLLIGCDALLGFAPDSSEADGRTRVILSTDMAMGLVNGSFAGPGAPPIDDGYAVALALAERERLDLLGLVTTHGNALMAPETIAAERLVAAIGEELPVRAGAAVALANPSVEWYDGSPMAEWCVNEGVEWMAEELRRAPLTVLAIGPLTDVACLARNYPGAAAEIERLIVLMGARPGTVLRLGDTLVADLNFTSDPIALQLLLDDTQIPVTAMTFEVTETNDFDIDALLPLAEEGNEVARYYHDASTPIAEQSGRTSFETFDVHTVWRLLTPEAYDCEQVGYELKVGQPASEPSADNDARFAPDLPGRRVEACSDYAQEGEGDRINEALLASFEALGAR